MDLGGPTRHLRPSGTFRLLKDGRSKPDIAEHAENCHFLGERGAPEGREDSSHEDLTEKFEPLASSSTIFKPSNVTLSNFVQERLQRRIKPCLTAPSVQNFPRETFKRFPTVETPSFEVYTDWLTEKCPISVSISPSGISVGKLRFSWFEIDSVTFSRDSGVLELPSMVFYLPERSSCLSLCSSVAFYVRNVISKDSSVFLATSAVKFVPSSFCSSFGSSRKSLTVNCRWKKTFCFAEVTENEVFLSENPQKKPFLILQPKKGSDVRLVRLNDDFGVKIGGELLLNVEKREEVVEMLQKSCFRREKIVDLVSRKLKEEKVLLKLKKIAFEVVYEEKAFSVDFSDVAVVYLDVEEEKSCFFVLKNADLGEMPVLVLNFHGKIERNAFLRRLCQSTDFLELSSMSTISSNNQVFRFQSDIFGQKL